MIVWHMLTQNQGVCACCVVILTIGHRFVPWFKMEEDFETKIFNVVEHIHVRYRVTNIFVKSVWYIINVIYQPSNFICEDSFAQAKC